ncbi:prohibitin family protein [Rhodocytophaga rosea]|uniref:Prohibitin family protein n=1 Tax=Rhodocytophaga rosea TaxID=2704465 RepID=A0A6C0GK28_9BACT|nr:prohibitin family protein [Rhodocytophaga rosea]QHT68174.1 prohibitin family protein [Rhodocytophaga rosea]
MLIAIIGIVMLIIAFSLSKSNYQVYRYATGIKVAGVALILIGALASSVVQVDAGEVGVQKLFGKVSDRTLESGLNVVNPLVEVTTFNIKTQNYTMSATHEQGDNQGDDAIRVLSSDGLEVVIDLTVLYKVMPAQSPNILREIGTDYKDIIVRPITRTKIRDNAVYYDAVSLYSTKREEFQSRIFKDIEANFKTRGLLLEQLLIRNLNLPASVKQTIESKINAEQEAQKMTFVLQKEKQEAERKRVEAQGIADYQQILSTGLSDKQLQYESIKAQQAIATSPNSKVIIMGAGRGNMPLLISDK